MGRDENFELITLYLDNQLDAEAHKRFVERLRTDSALRAEVQAQRRIKNYLQHLPKVEILNDNFKKQLLHRVEREVLPPKRNYRLNYATVTLALIFASFVIGGAVFGIRLGIEELNRTETYIARVETGVAASARQYSRENQPSPPSLNARVTNHIRYDVVGVAPEEFFSNVLAAYQSGEVHKEILAPFFTQTTIFDGATVSLPESGILSSKTHWVNFDKKLPTAVHVVIPATLESGFRDFMSKQVGSVAAMVNNSVSDGSYSPAADDEHIIVDIRFSSFDRNNIEQTASLPN